MPVKKVGKSGYKWGKIGKVYRGKNAKEKSERQAKAIYTSGYKEKSERKHK